MRRGLVVVVLLVAACSKNETQEQSELRMKTDLEKFLVDEKHRGPGASIKPAPVAAVTAAGPAYLAMSEGGIVKIEGGAATVLESPPEIQMLATGPTGELYALTKKSVFKLAGAAFEQLGPEGVATSYLPRLAVAPDGRLWLVDGKTALYWTGTAWKDTGKAFPDDEQYARSVAIDGNGRVYLSSEKMIVVHDQNTWKAVLDIRAGYLDGMYPSPKFLELVIAPSGELYGVDGRGIVKFDGTTVTPQLRSLKKQYLTGPAGLHGTTLVTMSKDWIVRWPLPTGEDIVTSTSPEAPLGEAPVLDGSGRVWGAIPAGGFSVVDAAGAVTYFPPGSLFELTSSVRSIAVAGGGPELPKRGEIARGSIKGVIVNAGVPLPKVAIEVCQNLVSRFMKDSGPCARQQTRKTTTDDSGAFEVKDLPLLDYGVATLVDGQWYGIRGKACKGLAAGAECDLGKLDIATGE